MIALAGLDLTDRLVVCVGAGRVAEKRIGRLRAAGARVRVVAPEATEGLTALAAAGDIEWLARPFDPSDLDDAWFCHTA
ncbi:NAD(P)-dependent oxidoreductase, partial [uncultured Microbacterium sp.]|uniref:precorrin-2 dehydrogenase/sirohydrochlorin ferrochelatase family protein n=1 Tax=uncultured Microbacterium sp. TaxID=191216 RepID=UPI0028D0F8DE